MDLLDEHFVRLKEFLNEQGFPEWNDVLFVEGLFIDAGSKQVIEKVRFQNSNDFKVRFQFLVSKGYSWLNMSGLGLIGNTLVVTVEKPNMVYPGAVTSINLSGPSNCVIQNKYMLDKFIEVSV